MPKFYLNKLVRDKLRDEYERIGQKAVCRVLSAPDHKQELIKKIIEETREIQTDGPKEEIVNEIADIEQVIDDLMALCGITEQQVADVVRAKLDKKGGFAAGHFVETLELSDGDEWVDYYRKRPEIFPEL